MPSNTVLADDRSIVIKKADKGSSIVVWDRVVYLKEATRQLSDKMSVKRLNLKKRC